MGEEYDPSQPSKYVTYLDANNLYGWAMSKPLPTGNFMWMKNLNNWRNRSCILEVDLEYPKVLHDLHNKYPVAPESLNVGNVDKFIPNLMNKERYIIHRDNLLLYESLGLKISKVHRGITFTESPWLKGDLRTICRFSYIKVYKLITLGTKFKTLLSLGRKITMFSKFITNYIEQG